MPVRPREPARLAARPAAELDREALEGGLLVADELVRDPGERPCLAGALDLACEPFELVLAQVRRGSGVVDDREPVVRTPAEDVREDLEVVAFDERRRLAPRDLERAPQTLEARRLIRPDERLEERRLPLVADVD